MSSVLIVSRQTAVRARLGETQRDQDRQGGRRLQFSHTPQKGSDVRSRCQTSTSKIRTRNNRKSFATASVAVVIAFTQQVRGSTPCYREMSERVVCFCDWQREVQVCVGEHDA